MTGPARYEKGYSDALAHVAEGKVLTSRDALVDLTLQAMVTGYVTLLLHAQDAIQRYLVAGMTPGNAVIAALGDEPAEFLDTRRDLTEAFVNIATLADDEALAEAIARDGFNRSYRNATWDSASGDSQARWLADARASLRALAAALTARGEQHG